jgi:hypothetical protein
MFIYLDAVQSIEQYYDGNGNTNSALCKTSKVVSDVRGGEVIDSNKFLFPA